VKDILKDVPITLPIVLMNGVCIYDPKANDYLKVEYFAQHSIDALMTVIRKYQLKGFAYTIKDGSMSTYYEELNTDALREFYQERVDRYQKKFIQIENFTSLTSEPLIYFSLIDLKENLEPIHQILQDIPDIGYVFYKDNYSPNYWYLEIYNKNASKYHAVEYLRTYLNVDNIVCFGDNHNDLPLFAASDYKIAVGNAVDQLKEKADLVIGKNYEDGVAVWLSENKFPLQSRDE
jgi:hydroxymethylpyrimidine pyrophosphatase-like HAD family hydrolase